MDQDWLDTVLAEAPPAQCSFRLGGELSAVVGLARGKGHDVPWVVTDVAVRPDLRGRGVGRLVLEALFDLQGEVACRWVAYVEASNGLTQRFFDSLGWSRLGRDPFGMWTFERPRGHRPGVEKEV